MKKKQEVVARIFKNWLFTQIICEYEVPVEKEGEDLETKRQLKRLGIGRYADEDVDEEWTIERRTYPFRINLDVIDCYTQHDNGHTLIVVNNIEHELVFPFEEFDVFFLKYLNDEFLIDEDETDEPA